MTSRRFNGNTQARDRCSIQLPFGKLTLLSAMPFSPDSLLPSTVHRVRTDQVPSYKLSKLALLPGTTYQNDNVTLPRARQALASIARTTEQGMRQLATDIFRNPLGRRNFTPTRIAEQYALPMEWIQVNRANLNAIATHFRQQQAAEPAQLATALSNGNLRRVHESLRTTSQRIEAQLPWIVENSRIYQRYQNLIQEAPALGKNGTADDFDQTFKLDAQDYCDEVAMAACDLFLSALATLELALRYKRYKRSSR